MGDVIYCSLISNKNAPVFSQLNYLSIVVIVLVVPTVYSFMFLFRMSSPAVPASSRPLPSYEAKVWLSIRLSSFSIVNKVDVKFCPTTESTSSASPTFPFSCRSSSRTTESSKTLWIKFSRLPLTTKRRARSQVNLNFHFKPFSFWLTNEFYSKGSAKMF